MRQFFLILSLFTMICLISYSQKEKSGLEKAIELSGKYPLNDVIALNSTVKINFKKRKNPASPVKIYVTTVNKLLCLDAKTTFYDPFFYNKTQKLHRISVVNKSNEYIRHKIITSIYEREGIFYDDYKVKIVSIDFNKKGDMLTLLSKEEYPDFKYFTSVFFNEYFPVEQKKICIYLPEWLDMEIKELNFEGNNITKSISQHEDYTLLTYSSTDFVKINSAENYQEPAFYLPHLLFACKKVYNMKDTITMFDSLQDMYTWYKQLINEIDNKPYMLIDLVNNLTYNLATDEEKIEAIYYWVQDNIRYIAFEDGLAGYKPSPACEVYMNRYGDCKGMANLVKEMLKIAGFDARLSWIGTRRVAYDYTLPTIATSDHQICTVILDSKHIFLDPTAKYMPVSEHGEYIQGKPVLIEDGINYILDTIPDVDYLSDLHEIKRRCTIKNTDLSGECQHSLHGEFRQWILYFVNYTKTNDRNNMFLKFVNQYSSQGLEIANLKTSDIEDRKAPFRLDYYYTLKNAVFMTGDDIYVNIDIDIDREYTTTLDTTRIAAYLFDFRNWKHTINELLLPEGYKVKYLPDDLTIDNDYYLFSLKYTSDRNKIILEKNIIIKKPSLPADLFSIWNNNIKKFREHTESQIIFTKIKENE
ncbi:MAG: transglutaminase domain-containing protein [Bacteroidia bacterium]|nr:transglutaminase domain-containing protein [Bacteroidia bacterium]